MPKIRNIEPLAVPSPLAHILSGFVRSPAIAAPLLAEVVQKQVAKKQVRIELNDSPTSFSFVVNQDRRIRTSIRGLEHLWGSLYAYQALYDLTKENHGKSFSLDSTKKGRVARAFLSWAFGDPTQPWPVELPRPGQSTQTTALITDNLFLMSCGFILLHEVGHVVLGHLNQPATKPEILIKRELLADDWAVDYIIRGNKPDELGQRLFAVAATLGVIGGAELYGQKGDRRDHPYPPDRIRHFFQKHVLTATADKSVHAGVLLAASVPIQAHLVIAGRDSLQSYQTFEEFFAVARAHYPS